LKKLTTMTPTGRTNHSGEPVFVRHIKWVSKSGAVLKEFESETLGNGSHDVLPFKIETPLIYDSRGVV
jgi:hypothetical protein